MAMSRSDNMRRIRSKDTLPELVVRRLIRSLGFTGYRLHRKDIPGKPDIAFIGRKKAIMVNGCFWHGHTCKEGLRRPKSNETYWLPKIERNCERDTLNESRLTSEGWSVLTVWECEIGDLESLSRELADFLNQRWDGEPQG
jgi:DNA mismatch endonuclease (patch repair protein)